MAIGVNGRVNIVITNRVLRYSYHKNASLDGLVEQGEVELPLGTVKDGKIMNRAALLEIINQLVHKQKWKRKKLFFCVPDDTVVIRQLNVPVALSGEEVKGYIKTQIGNSFHLPFGNPAIDIEILDTNKEEQTVLLFAYPKEKLNEFVSVFHDAGLKVEAADLTSLSIYRYYYLHEKNKNDDVLLIHWNVDSLILTAFNKHKAIFTRYRSLETTKEKIDEQLAIELINEQIIEINRIIDFYQFNITNGASSITKLLISGDFPFLDLIKNEMESRVSIPVVLMDELNENQETDIRFIDVLGLALKQEA